MKKNNIILKTICFAALVWVFSAASLPQTEVPSRMVNDFVGLFTSAQKEALEQKLRMFNDTSSTQIAVVVVSDLEGLTPNEYTTRRAEEWGIGQKGKDNGVLIMVKPKTTTARGDVYIAVGYGLEGAIPDVMAKRIIEQQMLPAFRQNNYYAGVDRAVEMLMSLASGEFTAEAMLADGKSSSARGFVFLFILIALFVLFALKGKRDAYSVEGEGQRHVSSPLPFLPFLLMGSARRHDDFGSFRGGGGSFGGGSFGGFGGGSFGGGGAGGSW